MRDILQNRLRTINIIGALVIVGGILGPAAFGALHLYRAGCSHVQQSADLHKTLSELDGLSKTLDQVEGERKQPEVRLADAESRLPDSNAMDQFMQQLAQVAEKAGLQLEAVMPDKDLKDAGGYKSLPVSISGTGKWDTCYRFLTGLRAMNRLTRLDSLTLASHKPDNGPDGKPYVLAPGEEPPCQITVNISTFMAR